VADRPCKPQLRNLVHLEGDLLATTLHECAKFDQEAVLVTHVLRDAVAVSCEPI
jgi:hypothetical protein